MTSLLGTIGAIILQIIGFVLAQMKASDEAKQRFYSWVAWFEAKYGVAVRFADQERDQIDRIHEILKAKQVEKEVPKG